MFGNSFSKEKFTPSIQGWKQLVKTFLKQTLFVVFNKTFFFKCCQHTIYIIIIIIIMSRRLRGYPWPSLAISPYHSSPPAGLQGYIPCPHIAAVCKFVLVVPLLHIHVWGSTGVHRLWARPCFSSSVLRVWFVELVIVLWWGASVRIVGVSWGVCRQGLV